MPKVHAFKIWDHFGGRYLMPSFKFTAERIAQLGGEPIPDTAEEVDESDLDDDGAYVPGETEGDDDRA